MKKCKVAIFALSLSSFSVMAQNIDVGSAATGALLTILIRGAIAFCLFKLITLNLTRKTLYSPVNSGKWVGAWLMGISILSNPSLNKSDIDFYVGAVIMAVVWFVIGFGIGFMWRKFKPLSSVISQQKIAGVDDESLWEQASAELNSPNKNEGLWAKCFAEASGDEAKARAQYLSARVSKLKQAGEKSSVLIANEPSVSKSLLSNPLVYVVALVVIGGGLFFANSNNFLVTKKTKDITFNVLSCKEGQKNPTSCEREKKYTAKFNPIKSTQKVIYEQTDIGTNKSETVEMDCDVVDDKNWKCYFQEYIGTPYQGIQFSNSSSALEMKDGVVIDTGMTTYSSSKYSKIETFLPPKKFVPQ